MLGECKTMGRAQAREMITWQSGYKVYFSVKSQHSQKIMWPLFREWGEGLQSIAFTKINWLKAPIPKTKATQSFINIAIWRKSITIEQQYGMERRRDRILLACHHLRYFKRFAQKNGRWKVKSSFWVGKCGRDDKFHLVIADASIPPQFII